MAGFPFGKKAGSKKQNPKDIKGKGR